MFEKEKEKATENENEKPVSAIRTHKKVRTCPHPINQYNERGYETTDDE
ncbi:hypothetical protein EROP_17140 [Erysipelotrichaceae bacterium OPF54]|nr:hypothetical protein EROP_17140 [Erysipelotrichaceae bacterium OPF54]